MLKFIIIACINQKRAIGKNGKLLYHIGNDISNFARSDIGIGITGKINRVDENNLFGDDNKIYYAIYDKNSDKYYEYELIAINDTRLNNKKYIMENISKSLLEIYK